MNTFNAVVLLLSDARGQYIPRDFSEFTGWDGITDSDRAVLADPGHDWYWEAWDTVLNNATYTDIDGNVFRLHQDGNLWAYCIERMSLEEQMHMSDYSVQCEISGMRGRTSFVLLKDKE